MSKAIAAILVAGAILVPATSEAIVQTYYCVRDSCPVEAATATFWWHLTN